MNSTRTLSIWQLFCFGLLTMPFAMSGLALVMFIPTFYAVDMGLGLAVVGVVFVFGRVLDVVTDPLIGHLSDQTRGRFGPRMPWIIIGTPFYCLSVWLLLAPPENVGLIYLFLVSALYFFFYSVVDVPYSSIGLEISPDVHERSYLASSKSVFQVLGAIVAASFPFVLALAMPVSLSLTAKVIIAISILAILLLTLFVPKPNREITAERIDIFQGCKWVFQQKNYRRLIGVFFIIQSANALTGALAVLYITHVIKAPALIGAALGLMFLATALFLPLWIYLSIKFDKSKSWVASIILCCCALMIAPFLQEGNVVGLMVLCCLLGACFGCDAIMPTSMLADIAYAGERDGQNRFSATYLAFKNAVSKLTFVIPMGIAFPILEWSGFDKDNPGDQVPTFTLVFFFAILPIIIRLMAILILKMAPVNQAKPVSVHE